MSARRVTQAIMLVVVLAATGPAARAAPDEIQVYTEEMDEPGGFGLELHLNYVPKGEKTAPYPGAVPSQHVFQATPEFSYGLTRSLEAGLYLPVAFVPGGHLHANGARLRLKFIAPRGETDRFFWGLNTEAGFFSRRVSESRWAMELRPIVGYRGRDWLVSFNPILDIDLSADVSREPKFEPSLKLTRAVAAGAHAGIEYYGEFGPIFHRVPASERAHTLYAVTDIEIGGIDINFGIGRGFGNTADRWVAKAIVSMPLR